MPSTSEAQHRLMEAAAHSPKVRQRTNIPEKVAKEFVSADERKGIADALRARKI